MPKSKIIQISTTISSEGLLVYTCLCADGSIWDKYNGSWFQQIDNKYYQPSRKHIPNIDNLILNIISENKDLTIKELHHFLELKCNEALKEQTTRKRVEGLLERKKIVGDGHQRNTRFKIK